MRDSENHVNKLDKQTHITEINKPNWFLSVFEMKRKAKEGTVVKKKRQRDRREKKTDGEVNGEMQTRGEAEGSCRVRQGRCDKPKQSEARPRHQLADPCFSCPSPLPHSLHP